MATKLTRLTHKIAIQLHLVAESCTICSSHSRWPVLKLLDTTSYNILVGKPKGKRKIGRPRRRWEDNIIIYLRVGGCELYSSWLRIGTSGGLL
jgi:hypothetical protein